MLAASFLLALGVSLASASPLQVPSHVDLIPQTHSGYKVQIGRETLFPSDVSQSPFQFILLSLITFRTFGLAHLMSEDQRT